MTRGLQSLCVAILFGAAAGMPAPGHASLIGDEVAAVFEAPNEAAGDNLWDGFGGATVAQPILATVGPGSEFSSVLGALIFADFDAATLQIGINSANNLPLGDDILFTFTDLDWVGASGAIVDLAITQNDFLSVDFSTTADSIVVEILNQDLTVGLFTVTFDIITRHVPVPATLVLFALGLAGIGMAARRRRPA